MAIAAPEVGWQSLADQKVDKGLAEALQESIARTRQLSPAYVHGDLSPDNLFGRQ